MQKKHDRRSDRNPETINMSGLRRASDSKVGVKRVNFPSFRVDPEDLDLINSYCQERGIDRAVLMRQIISGFFT